MDTATPQKTASLSHQAAKLSWVCPILIFLLLMFSRQIGARVIIERVSLLLIVVGFAFGVVALFGIGKHGKSGILAPAIVGIIINALLIFIFVTNFLAARARAQRGASAVAEFTSVAPAGRGENVRQTYEGHGLVFDFDGAYALKANDKTGQVLLQHNDSQVIVTSLRQPVDVVETVKLQASALQQDFKNQSYSGLTQSDPEDIDGLLRSGSVVRMGYDKPGRIRIRADVYILSDQTNSISLLHYYPGTKEANAKGLFQTVLQSLKDGG